MSAPTLDPNDRAEIARHPLLAPLPKEALSRVPAQSRLAVHPAGGSIFALGDPATDFFIVLDGFVKLTRDGHDGAAVVIATFASGDSFAEAAAFAGGGYPVWAEAVAWAQAFGLASSSRADRGSHAHASREPRFDAAGTGASAAARPLRREGHRRRRGFRHAVRPAYR